MIIRRRELPIRSNFNLPLGECEKMSCGKLSDAFEDCPGGRI